MAAQPKEYFDIETAAKKDTYLIDASSVAPEVLASRFRKVSGVEKIFYLSIIIATLALAVGLLYVKTKTLEVEGNTVLLNSQISVKQQKNAEYDQQIQDMTSGNKVINSVQKNGLSHVGSSNILKATK